MTLTGRKVGYIQIEERIGRGGMGDVYLGFHQKLKRKVAVKAILETKRLKEHTRTRFQREARALSRLDHPNICRIYDYMEEDDQDYLVLELIEGRSLKAFIAEMPLMSERLRVAQQLIDALAAAHEKGVIHRDVKPDNVMITRDGTVKVLDFGISRTENMNRMSIPPAGDFNYDPDTSKTMTSAFTQQGALVGTLQYMSPEQARGEETTAASDMYALGLVLQELFTGESAYEIGLPFMPMLRKAAAGESKPIEGLNEELTQLIERLKSMVPEARPTARETAEKLRYIASAPARKRKRRLIFASVGALAIFAMAMTFQAWRIRTEARRANHEAARAGAAAAASNEVSKFMISLFELADPNQALGNRLTARQLLDNGSARLNSFSAPPGDKARLMVTLGRLYRLLAAFEQAEPLLQEALLLRRGLGSDHQIEIAESLKELAELYRDQGRFQEALPLANEALSILVRDFGEGTNPTAEVLLVLSRLYTGTADFTRAREYGEQVLKIRETYLGENAPDVGVALSNLSLILDEMGENSTAMSLAERAIKILENSPNKKDLIGAYNNLAKLESQTGGYDKALALYEKAVQLTAAVLGEEHPRMSDLYNNIAVVYSNMRKDELSLPWFNKAYEVAKKAYGPDHQGVLMSLANIAMTRIDLGQFEEGIEIYQQLIESTIKLSGPDTGSLVVDYLSMARAYVALKNYQKAREMEAKAQRIIDRGLGMNFDITGVHIELMGNSWMQADKPADAEKWYRRALSWWDQTPDEGDILQNKINILKQLSIILRGDHREEEAAQMEDRSRKLEEEMNKPDTGI